MEPSQQIRVPLSTRPREYRVQVSAGSIAELGPWARGAAGEVCAKIAIVSNESVFGLYGDQISEHLRDSGFEPAIWLVPEGEDNKTLKWCEELLMFLGENGFTRGDAVLTLGGGVVSDLGGFAASIYLRGVELLNVPTTLLAMIDASVGGKTAVNSRFGKNTVGSFKQPLGVLIDVETLQTLDNREVASGLYEAVKQSAVGGVELLEQTRRFLEQYQTSDFSSFFDSDGFSKDLVDLVSAHVRFKASVIVGDEMERLDRVDHRSRKILNFGHTVAHALEKVTHYQLLKHGEAVGWGMLAALSISKKLELIDQDSLNLLNDVIASVGRLKEIPDLEINEIVEAFASDKKRVGGSLHWILLEGVGKPLVVESAEIPHTIVAESLEQVFGR